MALEGYNILIDKLVELNVPFVGNKFLQALILVLTFVIIANLFLFLVERVILAITAKTKTETDERVVHAAYMPIFFILIILGFWFGLRHLGLGESIQSAINKIILSVGILTALLLAKRVTEALIGTVGKNWAKKTKSTFGDDILPLIQKISNFCFYLLAVLIILPIWEINITGFLAGLGIAGIAVGFAVKDSLANIFGGISLVLDGAFKVGDKILLDSGEVGIIMDIGLRSTRLKTMENDLLIVVPNSYLANTKVKNFIRAHKEAKIKISFNVEYGTNVDEVKRDVLSAISSITNTLKAPKPEVLLLEMGDIGLKFNARFWIDDNSLYEAKLTEATEKIYKALQASKIGLPSQTKAVFVKK